MYGYSYGAAKADVWHIAAREAMTYPQYELAGGTSDCHGIANPLSVHLV